MNYILKIDQIVDKLSDIGETDLAKEIQELKSTASNSTELLMTVVFRLKQLLKINNNLKIVQTDVFDLLKYCNSIGLKVK